MANNTGFYGTDCDVRRLRDGPVRVAFFAPPKGEIIANTTGGTRKHKGRLDTATTPPAEASGVSGAMPTVRKEEGVVLVRDRVRLVRSGRGIAG